MNPPVPYELISAYFDGEVTADEREQVESLLENSVELRQFLDDTSKLSALLHSFPRESAPEDLAANVQKRVNAAAVPVSPLQKSVRKGLRREMTAFATGIMATIASLFAVYVSINHSPSGNFSENSLSQIRSVVPGNPSIAFSHGVEPEGDVKLAAIEATRLSELSRDSKLTEHPGKSQEAFLGASNSPVAQDTTQNEFEGLPLSDANNLFFNGARMEPIPAAELVKQLKTGDVYYVRTFLDPQNTVMVVEFTVVDIENGALGMQVVLQKKNIPQFESEQVASLDNAAKAKKDAGLAKRKKTPAKNDVVVFYVRAPGHELAAALEDLMNRQSDIYTNPESQSPIPLPASVIASNDTSAVNEGIADAPAADKNSPTITNPVAEQQPVAAEANIAANLFANSKGMKIDDEDSDTEGPSEMRSHTVLSDSSRKESVHDRDERQNAKSILPRAMASKSNSAFSVPSSNPLSSQSPQGYRLFHAAVDQRQLALKEGQQRSSSSPTTEPRGNLYQVPGMGNTVNPLGNGVTLNNATQIGSMPQFNNSGVAPQQAGIVSQQLTRNSGFRQQAGRSNPDGRDSQLMRMLIVLKSAELAAPKPAP